MARLIEQDRLFTQAMGGLFPEQTEEALAPLADVIDIACGPGVWATEVAFRYPHMNVVGVDNSAGMVQYASAVARVRGLENVSFEVMNAKEPLAFADNAFDLVNARFIMGFLDKTSWPLLLRECLRILRPGGMLRLTESDIGGSSSSALDTLFQLLARVLYLQGRTYSSTGVTMGITQRLTKLMREAGFQSIEKRCFSVDTSYGTDLYAMSRQNNEITLALLKPYLIAGGTMEENVFDELYHQALIDMLQEDFTNLAYGSTFWGYKPGQDAG